MWPKKVITGEWLAFEKFFMCSTDPQTVTTTTGTYLQNNCNYQYQNKCQKSKHQTKHVHFNEHPCVVVYDCAC